MYTVREGVGKNAGFVYYDRNMKNFRFVHFGYYSLPLKRLIIFAVSFVLWLSGIGVSLLVSSLFGDGSGGNLGGGGLGASLRYVPLVPFVAAYFLAGAPVLRSAWRNLARGNPLDESFLMSIATLGAFAVGEWEEAVGVMIFYLIGELVQEAAVLRSRRSIDALLALKPDTARVQHGTDWNEVRPEEVAPGSLILVRPGERIPLDGRVEAGEGYIDASLLSGESVPRRVRPGDEVPSGATSTDGALRIRTTKVAGESSAARIVALVENAGLTKARPERVISAFARVYTPIVVGIALLMAFIPPLVLPGHHFSVWIYRALIMLVISCPCALVLSVPLAYFAGIGGMSHRGILVKGAIFLDSLAKIRHVVFDKTGTLTEGSYEFLRFTGTGTNPDHTLPAIAVSAESQSNHPVALALKKAGLERGLTLTEPKSFREIRGRGVEAVIDGSIVLAGNERLLAEAGIVIPHDTHAAQTTRMAQTTQASESGTEVLFAVDGEYLGRAFVGDRIKAGSKEAVSRLRALGIHDISVLSGDNAKTVSSLARETGIHDFAGGLLPEEKLARLESFLTKGCCLAFVGDGINDAPVLSRADVGIAMGSGADVALEAADVIIMGGDPLLVPEAIGRARLIRRIVMQNIVFALGFKLAFISLGAFGLATMWEALIGDVGVALLAVLNSTRALSGRPLNSGPRPASRHIVQS